MRKRTRIYTEDFGMIALTTEDSNTTCEVDVHDGVKGTHITASLNRVQLEKLRTAVTEHIAVIDSAPARVVN